VIGLDYEYEFTSEILDDFDEDDNMLKIAYAKRGSYLDIVDWNLHSDLNLLLTGDDNIIEFYAGIASCDFTSYCNKAEIVQLVEDGDYY
jgi:hypothetical protein